MDERILLFPPEHAREAEAAIHGDAVDQEVFLAKHGYAIPESDMLAGYLLEKIATRHKKVLVLCDRFPLEAYALQTSSLYLLAEDLASAKAGEELLHAIRIQGLPEVKDMTFDCILLLQSISELQNPDTLLSSLYDHLEAGGQLWLLQENRVGFHRLGDHLMYEHHSALPKTWREENLKALFPHVTAYPIYDESDTYDDLLNLLIEKYPQHKRRMKNGLKLIETVFQITKE